MNDEELQVMFDFGASASLFAPVPCCPSPVPVERCHDQRCLDRPAAAPFSL